MYVLQNWTFTPGNEGEGTIEVPGVYTIEQFAHITNLTRNIPLFDSEEYEATITLSDDGVDSTLTLRQNTSFCDAADELQIVMYDLFSDPAATTNVAVTNFPATQDVSGTVSVDNFPTTTEVSNFPSTQDVSGTVSVDNFPTTTEVSNFPATQDVSGTVSVDNFPTTTEVSNFPSSVEISNDVGNPIPITSGLSVPPNDYISLTYTGGNVSSVVYKLGGAAGTTVATLSLTYDGGGNLLTVTRT